VAQHSGSEASDASLTVPVSTSAMHLSAYLIATVYNQPHQKRLIL
jgi:hypothetical protein